MNDNNCTICFRINEKQGLLDCGHFFCYDCIYEWFKKNKNCPMCRKTSSNIYPCANALHIRTSILDCLAFLKYELIPINISSSNNVNRCFYCKTYYGYLHNCISTTTKKITKEFFCSHCSNRLSYNPINNKIKGDVEFFLNQIQNLNYKITGYTSKVTVSQNNTIIESYDINTIGKPNFIPSNYDLIEMFYRKTNDDLKLALNTIFQNWDVEKGHYINEYDAERLHNIFTSSIPDVYNCGDLMDFFAKKVGTFLIRWDKCTDFQNIYLKGMIHDGFGSQYLDIKPNIELLIRFLYCLRRNIFKYLKWGYNTDHMLNSDFINIIKGSL